jgi:prepilin-type N-terminal cleavage/methylation domain-containing protein/prepilin-type processing-associated H-X9-DG protein
MHCSNKIKYRGRSRRGRRGAFTLIELLVVMLIIAFLASLLLVSLSRARGKARRVACLSNQRQLSVAWDLYAQDNQGKLVDGAAWVGNFLAYASDCADPGIMLDPAKSRFADYLRNLAVYKDPGSSCLTRTGDSAPREKTLPRSYSLNCWVGASKNYDFYKKASPAGKCVQFTKTSEMVSPSPSLLFTFLDMHPDSICAPSFITFITPPGSERIWHYPASYHDSQGVVSFADGHVESHKWVDPRTFVSSLDYHFGPFGHNHPSANNPDMLWLERHATTLEQEAFSSWSVLPLGSIAARHECSAQNWFGLDYPSPTSSTHCWR